ACLAPLGEIRAAAAALEAPLLAAAREELADLDALHAMLDAALEDEPPVTLRDGGLIREDWHAGLQALVRDAREAREWIAGLEGRERARPSSPPPRGRSRGSTSSRRSPRWRTRGDTCAPSWTAATGSRSSRAATPCSRPGRARR